MNSSSGLPVSDGAVFEDLQAEILASEGSPLALAQAVMSKAVKANLRPSEISQLAYLFVENFAISMQAIKDCVREAKNFREGRGIILNSRDLLTQTVAYCEESCKHFIYSDGGFHVYFDDSDSDYADASGFYSHLSDDDLCGSIEEEFGEVDAFQRASQRKELIEALRRKFQVNGFFDDAPAGLNVLNGFVRWGADGGVELVPHAPEHKARMKVMAEYERGADFGWLEEALAKSLRDSASLAALQEMAGAILFNLRPIKDTARRIFFLYGPRNSGKSTVIEAIAALFPAQALASVGPTEWRGEYNRARLAGVALNIVTELGGSASISGELLKRIASCEPVSARHPYGRVFDFRPTAWHVLATNELPRIVDKSDAFERRILCISFDTSLGEDEMDVGFGERLRERPSALINWAAVGAERLIANGRFTEPAGHAGAVIKMQHGDDVAAIMAAACVEAAPGKRITTREIRERLAALGEEFGLDPGAVNNATIKSFVGEIRAKYGAERHMNSGQPFYLGVQFRSSPFSKDLSAL